MRGVVVTGVSTGIGNATARALVKQGFHVFGSVRKPSDADRASAEWGSAFTPLIFDVTDEPGIRAAERLVRKRMNGKTLTGLVNNAGISIMGPLLHVPPQAMSRQLDVNIGGLLRVTQVFAPLLGSDRSLKGRPGRLINLGSVSGKLAYPFIGPYTISKFALEGLTDTLRQEMMLYGIQTILISPGLVDTPLLDKAKQAAADYLHTDFGASIQRLKTFFEYRRKRALSSDQVAVVVCQALTASRPKNRYTFAANLLVEWILPRALPTRLLNAAIAKQFGLNRGARC